MSTPEASTEQLIITGSGPAGGALMNTPELENFPDFPGFPACAAALDAERYLAALDDADSIATALVEEPIHA